MASISEEEAKIYDRQLRIWGVDAQQRMRASRVLVVGSRSLAAEICKNLALTGVGQITICDEQTVQAMDLGANFFLHESDVGKNRAESIAPNIQKLNPNVKIVVNTEGVDKQTKEFFLSFDAICLTGCSLRKQLEVNEICRSAEKHISFFSGDSFGYYAYFFEDLKDHSYVHIRKTEEANKEVKEEKVVQVEHFVPLPEIVNASWSGVAKSFGRRLRRSASLFFAIQVLLAYHDQHGAFPQSDEEIAELLKMRDARAKSESVAADSIPDDLLKSIAKQSGAELPFVTSVFGGLLGQEILKVLSGRDAPYNNCMLYNAYEGASVVQKVPAVETKPVQSSGAVMELDEAKASSSEPEVLDIE